MKYSEIYKKIGCKNSNEVFSYLIGSLQKNNIKTFDYFVNWDKVFKNTKEIEVNLNILNYLIGKEDDFDFEFKELIKKYPNLISIIPFLLVRDGSNTNIFEILTSYNNKELSYKNYNFNLQKTDEVSLNKYLEFVNETGLKSLIINKKVKNFVDYMIGVEAGLDSNARKNRSGKTMEYIIEYFIKDICNKNTNYKYEKQC